MVNSHVLYSGFFFCDVQILQLSKILCLSFSKNVEFVKFVHITNFCLYSISTYNNIGMISIRKVTLRVINRWLVVTANRFYYRLTVSSIN